MKKIIIIVLSILFGLMFINSGLNKFFNYMPMPENMPEDMLKIMNAFMELGWLMPLVAVAEIIGGTLFMISKFRALGAIVILPITVGIIVHHAVKAPTGLPLPLILFAINIWIIVKNRHKYMPMIK